MSTAEWSRKYRETEKGKAVVRNWNHSEKGKAALKKYRETNESYRKKTRMYEKRKNDELIKSASNARQSYTDKDDELILNAISLRVVAKEIGRSYKAVVMRRARLLGKTYAETH